MKIPIYFKIIMLFDNNNLLNMTKIRKKLNYCDVSIINSVNNLEKYKIIDSEKIGRNRLLSLTNKGIEIQKLIFKINEYLK